MRVTVREDWKALFFPEDAMDSQVERRERRRYASLLAKNIIENELSARQKHILVLYYKEQKTMPEIAQALGVSVSSVSHTHRRAFDTIRSRLCACNLKF